MQELNIVVFYWNIQPEKYLVKLCDQISADYQTYRVSLWSLFAFNMYICIILTKITVKKLFKKMFQ